VGWLIRGRGWAVAGVLAALLTMACGIGGRRPASVAEPQPATEGSASPVAPVQSSAAAADPPTSAPPTTRPSSRRPPVVPSKKPTHIPLPPPPPPPPPSSCSPSYAGPGASRSAVKAALDTAAARTYWGSKPEIKVPANLVYAEAWQESGWQSTIVACDGGIGTMQIMPDTATWMNQRFGTSYDVHTLAGNTSLGAQYLAWLIRYFGDVYFDSTYDLSNQALLDSVVAAYNVGAGAVDPTKGRDGIPNWRYVNNVEALMVSCPCVS
jgi:hypothetical protein